MCGYVLKNMEINSGFNYVFWALIARCFMKLALTPWWLVYKYIVPGNWPKTSSFQLPCQRHISSTECAWELFKPSQDLASLLLRTRKKKFWFGFADFLWV